MPAPLVCMGAMMTCSFGLAPAALVPTSAPTVMVSGKPAATIMDHQPIANIPTFGMCTSLANPQVSAATSAAAGVLTPMPCIPNTVTPWTPGVPTLMLAGKPALNATCTCMCLWAGVITISFPGQVTVLG